MRRGYYDQDQRARQLGSVSAWKVPRESRLGVRVAGFRDELSVVVT